MRPLVKSSLSQSLSFLPAKLLVQARKNKGVKTRMGFTSLPKVAVPSLPVVLLFGKMNVVRGDSRMERRQLESVQKVWDKWVVVGVGAHRRL